MSITTCTISGTLQNSLGAPVANAVISVFAPTPFWHDSGILISGTIATTTTATDGTWSVAVIETASCNQQVVFQFSYFDGTSGQRKVSYSVVVPNQSSCTLYSLIGTTYGNSNNVSVGVAGALTTVAKTDATTYYPVFVGADTSAVQTPIGVGPLAYVPSTNTLTATTFAGSLSGGSVSATTGAFSGTLAVTGTSGLTGQLTVGTASTRGVISITGTSSQTPVFQLNNSNASGGKIWNTYAGSTAASTYDIVNSSDSVTALSITSAGNVTAQGSITGTAISGTTGAFSSTLASTGSFAVNTNKFTVDASTGNTAVAGTLAGTTATLTSASSPNTLTLVGASGPGGAGIFFNENTTGKYNFYTGVGFSAADTYEISPTSNTGPSGTTVNPPVFSVTRAGVVTIPGSLAVTGAISGSQLTSTVSTGTAPLVVASTTQVANLNAATAGTATNATNVATTTKSDNVAYYPTFVAANSSSNQGVDVGPMTYNPSTSTLTATTFSGALSGNATTATTATNSTNAAITSKSDNVSYYPTFVAANSTSNQGLDAGPMTYNPSTSTLTATTFVGALTGNASGSSGSCTGNAATATALQTGRALNGTTFNGTGDITVPTNLTTKSDSVAYYLTFAGANSSTNQALNVGPATYNPSTGTITATTFSGALSGNATTATSATTATNATNSATTTKSDNVTYYPTFVAANSSSNQGIDVGPMTYNPSTSTLTATTFSGALSGNATTATTATNLSGGTVSGTTGAFSSTLGVSGVTTHTSASSTSDGDGGTMVLLTNSNAATGTSDHKGSGTIALRGNIWTGAASTAKQVTQYVTGIAAQSSQYYLRYDSTDKNNLFALRGDTGDASFGFGFATAGYDTSSATSGTITCAASKPGLLITGAGGTTLTIKLPSTTQDGMQYWVASAGAFTTVTWQDSGGTAGNVIGGQAAIGGTNRGQKFVYSLANTKWYNIG